MTDVAYQISPAVLLTSPCAGSLQRASSVCVMADVGN